MASPVVTALAAHWTADSLSELERRILDAIVTNAAEPIVVTGRSRDGSSTNAVIGVTLEARERLLKQVQDARAELGSTPYAATQGVTLRFDNRITGT